ncbi:MAG TPA: RdgB/HAM1 family non-canonical purine NTP pyrophosphatase [Candidatus Woesebacteria bacterium]|jgi:XTP/dITP diphosphohydrolase|nr:RdgB/HAM1 family non-canonical purine NTP pyrophosphatase [Candidatus Woesebacteria bacterium]
MSPRLLVASTNQGKLTEIKGILSDLGLDIVNLSEFPTLVVSSVEETGITFAENAAIKAKHYASITQLPTLAEDSGLIITALNGEPGVQSARWFPGSDEARSQAILSRMKTISNRSAFFHCSVCLYHPLTRVTQTFDGEVEGTIAQECRGEDGFGYDPIFIPNGYSETFAELGISVKNSLSHRHKALELAKIYLQNHPEFLSL